MTWGLQGDILIKEKNPILLRAYYILYTFINPFMSTMI